MSPTVPRLPTKLAPILVCGSATWFGSLSRHLCPKQALVHACDDALAPGLIQTHLAGGGRRGLWLSSTPFAASVAVSRAACCTAVLLPSLRELGDALAQANPQLLIVDSPRWTVAAIGNLVRTLVKHPIGASEAGPRSTK
ncbi:MAG: hypothetical protein IT423_00225 [Pirellulaceae bacterium]|nr:hypothetical protein [Pirellulaceae bacterium]